MKKISKSNCVIFSIFKKDSNGFTLIELLVVIILLAVLMLLVTSVTVNMLKNTKKKAFVNQVQSLYKAAEQQYMVDSLTTLNTSNKYYYAQDGDISALNVSGNDKIYYDIELTSGRITKIQVSSSKYSVSIIDVNRVKLSDINIDKVKGIEEEGYIVIGEDIPYVAKIYGVSWNGSSTPTLTRTDDAVGMNVVVSPNSSSITSDFNTAEIYSEMVEVTDSYGNVFIKIPKFYIKKTISGNTWKWQISKQQKDAGYYLPACFTNESNGETYPYILVGKYNASLSSDGKKLESKPNKEVLVSKNITQFRDFAKANGDGYQILDVHTVDVLQVLFYVEFATLDSTNVMQGFISGQYVATYKVASASGNTINVPSGKGSLFKKGQMIDVGSSLGGRQIAKNLRITNVVNDTITYETISGISTISGAITSDHYIYNVAYLTGVTNTIGASSGSEINGSGLYSMKYRGIENLYGNVWQFVDGINIKDSVAYVARDASLYQSTNATGTGYIQVGYTNATANNYIIKMGYDINNPFIQLPTEVGASGSSAYKDYFYQSTGEKIALIGGSWSYGTYSGVSYWNLDNASTAAVLSRGSRLLKTPL